MQLRSWENTQRVLESYAPIIRDRYSEFANLSKPITFTIGNLEVIFDLPAYWKYIELGRGPGKFPPPPAIQDWIQKRNILPVARNGITPTTDQLAYLIGRKISKEGTEGKHALEKTLTSVVDDLIRDLTTAIVQDVKDQLV